MSRRKATKLKGHKGSPFVGGLRLISEIPDSANWLGWQQTTRGYFEWWEEKDKTTGYMLADLTNDGVYIAAGSPGLVRQMYENTLGIAGDPGHAKRSAWASSTVYNP